MQAVLTILFFLFFWTGLLGISLFVTLVLCHEVVAFVMDYRAGFHDPYGFCAGQKEKSGY